MNNSIIFKKEIENRPKIRAGWVLIIKLLRFSEKRRLFRHYESVISRLALVNHANLRGFRISKGEERVT